MEKYEYSFLYIKAEHRGTKCEEDIRNRLLTADLDVTLEKPMVINEAMLKVHQPDLYDYTGPEDEVWKSQVRERMLGSEVKVMLVRGKDAVRKVNEIKGIIRELYCPIEFDEATQTTYPNCMHCPKDGRELMTDIGVFLKEKANLIKAINRIEEGDRKLQHY